MFGDYRGPTSSSPLRLHGPAGCLGHLGIGTSPSGHKPRACGPHVPTQSFLGHAIQVAQTSRALHWIVTALKDSGFGSGAGMLTLGEYMVSQEPSPIICGFESRGWTGRSSRQF